VSKPIGICFVSTRDAGLSPDGNSWPLIRQWYREAGLQLIKVQLPTWATTDPRDVLEAVEDGCRVVILCTSVKESRVGDGYDPNWIWNRLTAKAGSGLTYLGVIQRAQQTGATVLIEVGNEPDLEGVDPVVASRLTIEATRYLRPRLPGVRFLASMPTQHRFYDAFLTNQLLAAVDGVATHVYVYKSLFAEVDSDLHEWSRIWRRLMADSRVREVWVTEVGVNDTSVPYEAKAAECYQWLQGTPAKVKGAAWFTVGKPGRWDPSWDGYCLHKREHLLALGGKLGAADAKPKETKVAPAGSRVFRETGYWIAGEIRRFWEELERQGLALPLVGLPISEPFQLVLDGKQREVQLFERCALVVEPENQPPWRVHATLGRHFLEIWKAKGGDKW